MPVEHGENTAMDSVRRGFTVSAPPKGIISSPNGNRTRDRSQVSVKPSSRPIVILVLVTSDLLFAFFSWAAALLPQYLWGTEPFLPTGFVFYMAGSTLLWMTLRTLMGLYPGYGLSSPEELRRQTWATMATIVLAVLLAYAFDMGTALLLVAVLVNFVERLAIGPLVRYFVKRGLAKAGLWGKPVVILGAGDTGLLLTSVLREEWGLGFKPTCVFDFQLAPGSGMILESAQPAGSVALALRRAREAGVNTAIFGMPNVRREHLARFVDLARFSFQKVIIVPNLGGVTTSGVTARDLGGITGVEIVQNLLNPWSLRTKRALDLLGTLVGGTLIFPLLLMIALLIWADSGRPIFYSAKRMGKDHEHFWCLKFRTMRPGAEDELQRMLRADPVARAEYLRYHKLRNDPRVTRVGRLLRKLSLDELPQLWNVLCGEMSLVGPRPYLPRESEKIGATQRDILRVHPGMTGPWQVSGRNYLSFEERVRIDGNYIRNWSIWVDLVLLARTVEVLLFRRSAY